MINPDITKYLQSIRSVDDTEWICQTCNNHLKKGRVPPCAIANGVQFPEKRTFFYLNKLECRLIAPQLAFQKIFQAPRGGQLKITGNVDIQYIVDECTRAMYIVAYISKAQKGMSELLCKTVLEVKEGNTNIKQQVRDIGNKFLNSVEISAQEAVCVSSTAYE